MTLRAPNTTRCSMASLVLPDALVDGLGAPEDVVEDDVLVEVLEFVSCESVPLRRIAFRYNEEKKKTKSSVNCSLQVVGGMNAILTTKPSNVSVELSLILIPPTPP